MMVIPHLILKKEGRIFLTRRSSTNKIWSGHWHCVTGSIEPGESPREAIIREAEEEIGIKISDIDLETVVFLREKDYFDPLKKFQALELFFVHHLSDEQQPINLEPSKQDALGWFEPYNLPKPMIPGVAFGIKRYFDSQRYAEFRNA